jgi:hypothetical protein
MNTSHWWPKGVVEEAFSDGADKFDTVITTYKSNDDMMITISRHCKCPVCVHNLIELLEQTLQILKVRIPN